MRIAKLGKPIARKGYSPSLATREKLRMAQTGKRLSPETRRKISEANLKRWASVRHRQQLGRRRMDLIMYNGALPVTVGGAYIAGRR